MSAKIKPAVKGKQSGQAAFNAYYEEIYGERWLSLKSALELPPAYVGYETSLLKPYFLDAGSVLAASCLPLENAEKILDLCAAPGGKSLVLSSRMNEGSFLVSNERSQERRFRLLRVLDEHLPSCIRQRITVTGRDAAKWCRFEREIYDAVLLDAPCSTERHVMADKKYLDQWTAARIKNLAATQWALLSSAFLTLKSGGFLLYATCSLAPSENDGVVKKLFAKYQTACLAEPPYTQLNGCCAEKTSYGFHVLPDVQNGAGPLYFALITKQLSV